MIWIFERGGEQLTWEVRRGAAAYEIAVKQGDGAPRVQTIGTASELVSQVAVVPEALLRAGWRPCQPPAAASV